MLPQKFLLNLVVCTLALPLFGQVHSFDKLSFRDIPKEWSQQETLDKLVFSNYNVTGAAPATLTIFKSVPIEGKPDQLMTQYWRQYLQLSDTATAPKSKKQYNLDGDPMLAASGESAGPDGRGYYVLAVYYTSSWMQPLLIFTPSAKAYRLQLADWLDRLQSVKILKANSR